MIRDTGSTCTLVNRKFINDDSICGELEVTFGDGVPRMYPKALVELHGDKSTVNVEVAVIDTLPVDCLLGHDTEHITSSDKQSSNVCKMCTSQKNASFVVTRSQTNAATIQTELENQQIEQTNVKVTPLNTDSYEDMNVNVMPNDVSSILVDEGDETDECVEESDENEADDANQPDEQNNQGLALKLTKDQLVLFQQRDHTLKKVRNKVRNHPPKNSTGYFLSEGLIYRRYFTSNEAKPYIDQLVVPKQCRNDLLMIAHSIPLAGHLGVDKTRARLLYHYYWPKLYSDVMKYCGTCLDCQKTGRIYKADRAVLKPIPAIGTPFKKISMDIVGPLPRTHKGNRFVLTVVDFSTRYPEAFALRSQTAEEVANALILMFSRVGIPDEIVSDQGTNFMSELMKQLCNCLNINKIRATPYHPQTSGLVERWNGSLKSMLRKFVHNEPKTWDEMLPYVLFAYREVPEASTGFSPFELIYGWPVRGPLSIVKQSWLEDDPEDESLIQYVIDVRTKLAQCVEEAHQNLKSAQGKMKHWYDANARGKSFNEGEEVLLLLPTSSRSLEARWQGPYKITRKLSDYNYEVDTGRVHKRLRIYHVNLLKKWKSRQEIVMFSQTNELSSFPVISGESWNDVTISEELNPDEYKVVLKILEDYSDIFSDIPAVTDKVIHHIDTGNSPSIRQHAYRIPHALKDKFCNEMEDMLNQGIIEKSHSPWAAPVVIVPKLKDGKPVGLRICIDYRRLNSVSNFDPFPLPRMEELIESLAGAKYITKLDLTKGYFQIPLSEETKVKSAFITPYGLYQFNVMPFGMKSAPATFQRMMQQVLSGLEKFASAYIDDVIIHSITFDQHISDLISVLQRLREAKLIAKPSKCMIGHAKVQYLGHLVGAGELHPLMSKVESIEQFPIPETKKQLRSYLGLVGYYRRYIPNFSEIATPLSDVTGKKSPNKLKWNVECENSFSQLKRCMINYPVLQLPDFSLPFIVQVDASERALGAILSQKDEEGSEHPVVYASRKLLDRESKLSTTEKECLGLVWAIDLFRPYLYGTEFTVETDHNALVWLYRVKDTNQKLLRWSIMLQEYSFIVKHRRGVDHKNADALSRI